MAKSFLIGVTGARGYVGGLVQRHLNEAGYRTVSLARSQNEADVLGEQRFFDLSSRVFEDALTGLDGIVHCAWDMTSSGKSDLWATNVEGSNRLVEAATRLGVRRVIFMSSMAAFEGTRQWYGLTKLACERPVLRNGYAVLRPGLVYGPGGGGIVGRLRKVCHLPVVPLVAPKAMQFTVHEEDLAQTVITLLEAKNVPSVPLGVAHNQPVAVEDIMRTIAATQGRHPRYVHVPWIPILAGLRAAEAFGLSLPFKADSLLGLVYPPSEVPYSDLARKIGISVRPFAAEGDWSGATRAAQTEGPKNGFRSRNPVPQSSSGRLRRRDASADFDLRHLVRVMGYVK